jgi:hypothetical protein
MEMIDLDDSRQRSSDRAFSFAGQKEIRGELSRLLE